jgi:diphosphomevalonate decarboxylase
MNPGNNIIWRSPSNIALIKYWGKLPGQIPANPSLSLTLSKANSLTSFAFRPLNEDRGTIELEFYFDGKKNEKFREKVFQYMQYILKDYPSLSRYSFRIESMNTFPHSTGIASSASGMSALALCLADFLSGKGMIPADDIGFFREASRLSRLASGSACRSVYGGFTAWGLHKSIPASSDEYAVPVPFQVHANFADVRDAILIVSSKEKSVSSRVGHSLMNGHPFAGSRYKMAHQNLSMLLSALETGDQEAFMRITELEALVLHGLMMSSNPSYFLFEPNTVSIVNSIRRCREETGIPVCFTLDAGPNVHLLYPGELAGKVQDWIKSELTIYCQDGKWIDDQMGYGPERLNNEK